MSSKKKIAISVSAIALIVVVAVVAVVAVFATRSANVNGNFGGQYTANHVNATVTGAYKKGAEVTDEEGWTNLTPETITFTSDIATGSGDATKSFNAVNDIVLTASQSNVIFKYTITNTSSSNESFTIVGTQAGTFENITVSYMYQEAEGDAQELETSQVEGSTTTNALTLDAGENVTIYVIVSITNIDQNATFNGSVNWALQAV